MYAKFTDRARKAMQLANQEAQRFNHEYIGTEHILAGLAKEGSGVAANALKNLDIDLRKIRMEIEKIVKSGPELITGKLPQTPRASKVVEFAIEQSKALGDHYIGTEHVLLGLLQLGLTPVPIESVAIKVLLNLGIKLEEMRQAVLEMLKPKNEPKEEIPTGLVLIDPQHTPCYAVTFPKSHGMVTEQVEYWLRKMLNIPATVAIETIIVLGK